MAFDSTYFLSYILIFIEKTKTMTDYFRQVAKNFFYSIKMCSSWLGHTGGSMNN